MNRKLYGPSEQGEGGSPAGATPSVHAGVTNTVLASAGAAAKERLEHLFRYCTRQGSVNPLLYVLNRYRAKDSL